MKHTEPPKYHGCTCGEPLFAATYYYAVCRNCGRRYYYAANGKVACVTRTERLLYPTVHKTIVVTK